MSSAKSKKEKKDRETRFKLELKKAFPTAVIAAFGFLTALAWRDVISEAVSKIETISPVQGKTITALIVTFCCVCDLFDCENDAVGGLR